MAVIHMQTEVVSNLASNMKSASSKMVASLGDLVQKCRKMDWDGLDRTVFLLKLNGTQSQLDSLLDKQDQLAFQLQQEIQQWTEEAYSFNISRRFTIPNEPRFDWPDFLMIGGKTSVKIIPKIPITEISGYVKWFPVLGLILGIWDDRLQGDDWGRAIFSEIIDTALNLTPIGLYSLALSINKLGFSLYGGISGNLEYSEPALAFLDKLDFTEKLGDAIYDFATQDPGSFLLSISIPGISVFDPDYENFVNSFIGDNMRDFGWDNGAAWVENNSGFYNGIEQMKLALMGDSQMAGSGSW